MRVALPTALVAWGLAAATALADGAPDYPSVPVFEVPAVEQSRREAIKAATFGQTERALAVIDELLERSPGSAPLLASRAVAQMAAGRDEAALASLRAAAAEGFVELPLLAATPLFAPLREDGRLAEVLSTAAQPAVPEVDPAPLGPDRSAVVTEENSVWRGALGAVQSFFAFRPELAKEPIRAVEGGDDAARLLVRLQAQGKAAGNAGDLYDNRDGGHSTLPRASFPQLGFVVYGPEATAAGLNYGANLRMRYNAPTVGNSSTAATAGPFWRGQPRFMLTHPDGPLALASQYVTNHLYVYPAHKDFGVENGDLIPANTPYMIASRGSSGSDKPFMRAALDALAAMRPDTKRLLVERGLVAPTLQMILRRNLTTVRSDEAYLSAAAHPAAFEGGAVSRTRMVAFANGLQPEDIPPAARIEVVSEAVAQAETAASIGLREETLFDTLSAASRIIRMPGYARRYVLSAEATQDPSGRPLRFEWRAFGAGADSVRFTPRAENGAVVEALVLWPGGEAGGRLDIAVFADNGAHLSAPAFLSVLFPAHEPRAYDPGGRLLSVDYAARGDRYADPLLFPARDWRDEFQYDDEGRLLGWVRTRGDGTESFTRHGLRVTETDAAGRALRAERLYYRIESSDKRRFETTSPSGEIYVYRYSGPEDRLGEPTPIE